MNTMHVTMGRCAAPLYAKMILLFLLALIVSGCSSKAGKQIELDLWSG
ncbi:MAG: hypothetical protein K9M17_07185 [Mariprofundaceae bacterium]|nr:hypothetical protein [Mariprofundaceae bacterium]